MHPFPHQYTVTATAGPAGVITHPDDRLPSLLCTAPVEFGGPGDQWSPEDLLAAAVADCFILTFRAVAAASTFTWDSISARAEGQLDRVDRTTLFTSFDVHVTLGVPVGTDLERAQRLLEKAEANCLITNSMTAARHLHATVVEVALA